MLKVIVTLTILYVLRITYRLAETKNDTFDISLIKYHLHEMFKFALCTVKIALANNVNSARAQNLSICSFKQS